VVHVQFDPVALRMPGAIGVDIDASGEMQNTELLYG